ncbi:MAG: FAD-dependent oxidoreductase [Bacilli bacterium]|nr:FAD-dependent oxidoreductase [Bacilli bacterium]
MKIKELADYCLKCKNPNCVKGCPLHNDIPTIMELVSNEQYVEAHQELLKTQVIPELCGLLCAHDHQCEGKCVRGIKGDPVEIGNVEYLLGSMYKNSYLDNLSAPKKALERKSVVIVGAGITGITASIILARAGLDVTLFEKEDRIGGTVDKFVPNFRHLTSVFTDFERHLRKLNVNICLGKELGKDVTYEDLEKFDYKIIATGAMIPTNIWNDHYPSCFYGLDILKDFNKNECTIKGKNIIVLGAGNVAMDVSRALKRLKNNVTVVYRRTLANSPASIHEINAAKNDKVNFVELWAPIKPIVKNEVLVGLQVQKMRLVDDEKGGRKNVVPVEGAISIIPCDTIVIATGAKADKTFVNKYHIDTKKNSYLTYYFGGDFYTGPKTIVEAIKSGKDISNTIIEKINKLYRLKDTIKDSKKKVFFGGSFNPPTIAHYNILKLLSNDLNANVLLVPNGDDYHYHNKELLTFDHRVEMLKLMTKDLKNIEIITSEQNKAFKGSVETLKEYNHPWFVIGADSLAYITTWIDAKKLIRQNRFIVLNREGFDIDSIFQNDRLLTLYRHHFTIIDFELGDVSSSNFRSTFDESLVTKEVYNYIINNNLYKEDQDEQE